MGAHPAGRREPFRDRQPERQVSVAFFDRGAAVSLASRYERTDVALPVPPGFGGAIAGLGFKVVIFDSLREFLARLGYDPDPEADLSAFFSLAVTPLVRRGGPLVPLDNLGHVEKHPPKGSATTLDAAPEAYEVNTASKLSPTARGRISVTGARLRYGDEGRERTMRVGRGRFGLRESADESPTASGVRNGREKREDFPQATVAVLAEDAPLGRNRLVETVRGQGIKGPPRKLRDLLAYLAANLRHGIVRPLVSRRAYNEPHPRPCNGDPKSDPMNAPTAPPPGLGRRRSSRAPATRNLPTLLHTCILRFVSNSGGVRRPPGWPLHAGPAPRTWRKLQGVRWVPRASLTGVGAVPAPDGRSRRHGDAPADPERCAWRGRRAPRCRVRPECPRPLDFWRFRLPAVRKGADRRRQLMAGKR